LDLQASAENICLQWKRSLVRALTEGDISFITNSPEHNCLSNTLNISFPNLDGRMILPALDVEKISLSAGSACASGAALASSVLLASGIDEKLAQASLRISFRNTYPHHDVDKEVQRLASTINRLYKVANP
jgi:cysteine desulfurase